MLAAQNDTRKQHPRQSLHLLAHVHFVEEKLLDLGIPSTTTDHEICSDTVRLRRFT